MRKILTALLTLLTVACAKTPQQFVTVSFDFTIQSGQIPTKSIPDAIAATIPASLDLVLTSSDGKTYSTTTGQEISLPVGRYSVTGGYSPSEVQVVASGRSYTTHSPIIEVNDSVTIVEDVTSYQVAGEYKSFAVCVLPEEVSTWTAVFRGANAEIDCVKTSDLWFVFVTGNLTGGSAFMTKVETANGEYKEYTLYTNPNDTQGIRAYYGKWYLLRPFTFQSGAIGISLPEWESGL